MFPDPASIPRLSTRVIHTLGPRGRYEIATGLKTAGNRAEPASGRGTLCAVQSGKGTDMSHTPWSIRALLAAVALGISWVLPSVVLAAVPDGYQVIRSRAADAAFSSRNGCILTDVFVSSSANVFGGRPGPVDKQGLTSLMVIRSDTCLPLEGKHHPEVFRAIGQTLDPLVSTPSLDRASITSSMATTDIVSGRDVELRITLNWLLVGTLERDTGHGHLRIPGVGIVNGHSNTLMGSAVAFGTLTIDGATTPLADTSEAHLQQIKAACQVIVYPHADSPDLDCI